MNIEFDYLKIKNFRSVRDAEIAFTSGLHVVVGYNEVASCADSNGSGKSSIFSYAIPYVIHGKFQNPRGKIIKSGITRRGSDGLCECELGFKVNGTQIVATRGRKNDKPFFKVQGSSTPIRSDADLSFMIGCDFQTLTSLLVLTRSSIENSLFYGTDSKRKEFFLSIAGIDKMIADAVDIIKREQTQYSLDALELRTLHDVEQTQGDLQSAIDRRVNDLNQLTQRLIQVKQEIETYNSSIDQHRNSLSLLTTSIQIQQQKLLELAGYTDQIGQLNTLYEQRGGLQTALKSFDNHVSEASRYQNQIGSLVGRQCPTCGQQVMQSYFKDVEATINEMKKSVEKTKQEKQLELNDVQSSIQQLEALKIQIQNTTTSINTSIRDLQSNQSTTQRIIDQMTTRYASNMELMNECESMRIQWERELKELQYVQEQRKFRLSQMINDWQCLNRFEGACSNWQRFLKQQLPAFALKEIVGYVSQFADRCLRALWDSQTSLKILFDPVSDSLEITIIDTDNRVLDVDSLSTGEQARVFLSLALGSIIATRNFKGWSSNIFVLDEVFDGLDRAGREVVLDLLNSLAAELNICVIVISHHQDYIGTMWQGSVYTLVKDENGSFLKTL